jgi:putative component of membrane protein insertase Oxa1/YidC/SpoIIIJ protein YidD
MRSAALAAIGLYQKYISPYKGFCCAYRQHTGRASCSTFGYRAVRRHGVLPGLSLIRRRTELCGVVHRHHHAEPRRRSPSQRGDCDLGCALPCEPSCDLPLPSGNTVSKVCDFANCCDCGSCDWPDKKKKQDKDKDDYVYIPPNAWRPKPKGQGREAGPNPSIERTRELVPV